ncbi:hypothetical protein AURDEDRAFT_160780 [Auricularia subglabra TFB-10046 SS5]|nr:hypothetical protein AURDEDRAFT_160780 [Auricularia subglabra TFB-10046 SS5]
MPKASRIKTSCPRFDPIWASPRVYTAAKLAVLLPPQPPQPTAPPSLPAQSLSTLMGRLELGPPAPTVSTLHLAPSNTSSIRDHASSPTTSFAAFTAAGTIPRPRRWSNPGQGCSSLRTVLGWSKQRVSSLKMLLCGLIGDHLDPSLPYGRQEPQRIDEVCHIACTHEPELARYEDAWAVRDIIWMVLCWLERKAQLLAEVDGQL